MPNVVAPSKFAKIKYGTTANRPASGPDGFMYFDTDKGIIQKWDGSTWVTLTNYPKYTESYSDVNSGTVFDHTFDVSSINAFAYQLTGYILNRLTGQNPILVRLNSKTGTTYIYTTIAGVTLDYMVSKTSFEILDLSSTKEGGFHYVLSAHSNVAFISGGSASRNFSDRVLILGSLYNFDTSIETIQVYTAEVATGSVTLSEIPS